MDFMTGEYSRRGVQPTAPRPPSDEYESPPPYSVQDMQPTTGRVPQYGCPVGLEYLSRLDQVIVKQKIEILEVLTGFETNNQYEIQNSIGQNIFRAQEDTDVFTRNFFDPSRPFDMKILDNHRQEVLHLNRPWRCSTCCFPCCLQQLKVSTATGNPIGYVQQKWSIITPYFEICDAHKSPLLLIEGQKVTWSFGGDVAYKVLAMDGRTELGRISKQWGGVLKEMFTDADTFSVTFPMDLDVNTKAIILGACFLIDFMYYEETNSMRKRKDRNRCRTTSGSTSWFSGWN